MYIDLTISDTSYSFQKRDEAGVAIGSADSFLKANYRLDFSTDPRFYYIWPQGPDTPINEKPTFPPKASYPVEKILIKTT